MHDLSGIKWSGCNVVRAQVCPSFHGGGRVWGGRLPSLVLHWYMWVHILSSGDGAL